MEIVELPMPNKIDTPVSPKTKIVRVLNEDHSPKLPPETISLHVKKIKHV